MGSRVADSEGEGSDGMRSGTVWSAGSAGVDATRGDVMGSLSFHLVTAPDRYCIQDGILLIFP